MAVVQESTQEAGIHEVGDTFDEGYAGDSILNDALASGESVQIFRKPKEDNQRMSSIMGFFGGDEVNAEDVVTAQPSSLFTLRQMAKKNLQEAQNAPKGEACHPTKRKVHRSRTFGTESKEANERRRSQILRDALPVRSSSPAPPRRRSAANDPNNLHDEQVPLQESEGYETHQETIKRLTVQDDELEKLLQDPLAFGKLQKVLRKHGAVTNEVLKQVLPLYVKHQLNSQAAKEAEKRKQEDDCKRQDRQALVGAIQQHSARDLCQDFDD